MLLLPASSGSRQAAEIPFIFMESFPRVSRNIYEGQAWTGGAKRRKRTEADRPSRRGAGPARRPNIHNFVIYL